MPFASLLICDESLDGARGCPRAPAGASKYLIPLGFRKSEGGQEDFKKILILDTRRENSYS
jgi:hypothetical protein